MIFNLLTIIMILTWGIYLFWDYKTGKKVTKHIGSIQCGSKCYSCHETIEWVERKLSLTKFDNHMRICKNCARDEIISNVTNNFIKFNGKGISKGSLRYKYLKFILDIRLDFALLIFLLFNVILSLAAIFIDNTFVSSIISALHGIIMVVFWGRYILRMLYGITTVRKLAIVK